jgi:hypothetical protein
MKGEQQFSPQGDAELAEPSHLSLAVSLPCLRGYPFLGGGRYPPTVGSMSAISGSDTSCFHETGTLEGQPGYKNELMSLLR